MLKLLVVYLLVAFVLILVGFECYVLLDQLCIDPIKEVNNIIK